MGGVYLLIFAYIEDDLVFSLTWTKKHKCIWATMIHADREGVFQWAQVVYTVLCVTLPANITSVKYSVKVFGHNQLAVL